HAPARTDRHARNQPAGARHTAAGTEPARPNVGLGGGSDNDGRTPGYGTPASTGTHACARVITCTSSAAATASAHRPTDVHIRMIGTPLPHRRFSWSAAHSRRSGTGRWTHRSPRCVIGPGCSRGAGGSFPAGPGARYIAAGQPAGCGRRTLRWGMLF